MSAYSEHLIKTFSISRTLKNDKELLWGLEDKQFFSAGACHILAYEHKKFCNNVNVKVYLIQPLDTRGFHVYTSNKEWCFDAFGYQNKDCFINTYIKCCQSVFGQNWECNIIEIQDPFEEFCKNYAHRDKDKFLRNPFPRAHLFIRKIHEINDPVISGLKQLLLEHSNKRICVVGTTCTGKSSMVSQIPEARDQDEEVFPKLSAEEKDFVCQFPWTEEIGRTMTKLVRDRVLTAIGKPVFGTVVIDCDLVVLLKISDKLHSERTSLRKVQFNDAKNMQLQIEEEVKANGFPYIEYSVG